MIPYKDTSREFFSGEFHIIERDGQWIVMEANTIIWATCPSLGKAEEICIMLNKANEAPELERD